MAAATRSGGSIVNIFPAVNDGDPQRECQAQPRGGAQAWGGETARSAAPLNNPRITAPFSEPSTPASSSRFTGLFEPSTRRHDVFSRRG